MTPPSIEIVHASTPENEVLIYPDKLAGFRAGFFWDGATQPIEPTSNCCGGMDYGSGINAWLPQSRWFGWYVKCVQASCGAPYQILDVRGVQLIGLDTTPPAIFPLGWNNIWYQAGHWIRGAGWPASFSASDDSGICAMSAKVGSQTIPGPADGRPNHGSWTQCPDPQTMNLTINTTQFPDGALPLTLLANDAATPANASWPTTSVNVDNTPVALTLGGPTDASASAGTQYVTATAIAGPSGAAIACSLDGSQDQWYSATAQIPVSGVGTHQLRCFAQNNALDPAGDPARSAIQTWTLRIGDPTVMGIAFTRLVDQLRCRLEPVRVWLPARWVPVHRHHKVIHVKRPAGYWIVKQTRCHPRTARRRIFVWKTVTRHGHKVTVKRPKWIRVVLAPHVVRFNTQRIPHGRGTTVGGWLGTSSGAGLGGQFVQILTAPNNGQGRFTVAATVTTFPDGGWSARLPAGPSRLVEAVYDGSSSTEPTASEQLHLNVPARVKLLKVSPRHVPWGGTVKITGQLLGAYLPPEGALVRLRIGAGSAYTTYGVKEHVTGDGRFSTVYTFGAGEPRSQRRFWFQLSSLPMGDYPWLPSASARRSVEVGGHPRSPRVAAQASFQYER